MAFTHLLHGVTAHRYGIEIDANRAEQAKGLGIETLQANTMDVKCPPEAVSLLYLNPPYDWESGGSNNQRLESVFLEHTYRWLRAGGLLLFVIPQLRLAKCARLLSEHFTDLRVFRLTEPACLQYKQIVVLATRRKRYSRVTDAVLLDGVRYLEALATKAELEPLGDTAEIRYAVPASEPAVLTNTGTGAVLEASLHLRRSPAPTNGMEPRMTTYGMVSSTPKIGSATILGIQSLRFGRMILVPQSADQPRSLACMTERIGRSSLFLMKAYA